MTYYNIVFYLCYSVEFGPIVENYSIRIESEYSLQYFVQFQSIFRHVVTCYYIIIIIIIIIDTKQSQSY